jgi:uncharacterized protein (TIGR03067 family)
MSRLRALLLPALLVAVAPATFAQPKEDPKSDDAKALKALEGKYTLTGLSVGGKSIAKPEADRETFAIRDGKLIAVSPDGKKEDPLVMKLSGANVDFTEPGKPGGPHMLGVFKVDGPKLIFCVVESNKPADRPKDTAGDGAGVIKMEFTKVEEKPKDKK